MDIVHYVSKLQNVFLIRNDDDLADRLNYRYTVAILIAFAVIVSNRQFSETVIKCWVPAFFTPNYETYANQVCWVSNTYYVNQTQNVPKGEEARKKNEIKYYQWIPFILLIQALFLYIPRILWRLLSARAGLDMRDLVEAAHSYKSVEKFGCKKKIMEYIVHNIDQYASNPRRSKAQESIFNKIKYFGESLFCGSGIYLGNYLVTTYFFIKIVYLVNSIVQFFIMNEFLGKQFHELGLDILRYLTNSYSLENSIESVYFPKVVMCDFHIREFGHPNFSHKYTIQCVLPINLYNQQIFTFLWFWFLLLFFANCYALAQWISRMLPRARRRYVNRRLNMLNYFQTLNVTTSVVLKRTRRSIFGSSRRRAKPVSLEAKRQKRKFIDEYLKFDGVFILRMIAMLTSELVGTELLHELWNKRAGGVLGLGDAYDDGSVYGGGSFHERHHGGSEIRKAPIGFYTGPPPTISTSDYENMMNKESNFQTSPEHQHHHHHHHNQQQQQQEITDNDANLITTNVVEIGGLSMEQQQQQPPPSMSPPLGMMMMGDQTLEPPLRASPVPLSITNSESDSRRSSTKRRVTDMAAMRLRHQYSMESAPAPPMSPPVASLQQQQQQPAAPSLPFNRISRQRLKRLTRESSQRAGDELAVDNLSSTSMPTQAPSPTPQMNVVPPSVAAAIMSSAPAQRSSGSSLRQSILGGVSALRKMSSDSTSKLQQMQQMQQSTNMTPTNIPASSVSSISHGGSVKQPKKVAFAKSELDDYDEQLVFKPHEFDDVFSDLKFES